MTLNSLITAARKIVSENAFVAAEDIFFAVITANDGSAKQAQIVFVANKIIDEKELTNP